MRRLVLFVALFFCFYGFTQTSPWTEILPKVEDTYTSLNPANSDYVAAVSPTSGVPYVFFPGYQLTDNSKVVRFIGGVWQALADFPTPTGVDRSLITVSSTNIPYIAYFHNNDVSVSSRNRVQKYNGVSWDDVGVKGEIPEEFHIDHIRVNPVSGEPYVVGKPSVTSPGTIDVKRFNGTAWVNVSVIPDTAADFNSISTKEFKFDSSGVPYVLYTLSSTKELVLRKFTGTTWEQVGTSFINSIGATAPDGDFDFDSTDVPYITIVNASNRIYVKKIDGMSWVDVGDQDFSSGGAQFPEIIVTGDDKVVVGFLDTGVKNDQGVIQNGIVTRYFNGDCWFQNSILLSFNDSNLRYSKVLKGLGSVYYGFHTNLAQNKVLVKKNTFDLLAINTCNETFDDVGEFFHQEVGTIVTDVLLNDRWGGASPLLSQVTLTQISSSDASISLNTSTGTVNTTGTNTGVYTLTYRINTVGDPLVFSEATITITIKNKIDAIDDSFKSPTGFAVTTDSVLLNDKFNLETATTSNVTLTEVSSSNSGISLNITTGEINISATVPAGVHTLDYSICDKIDITNCDTATMTITVDDFIAMDDEGEAFQGEASSVVANVLANDGLNGAVPTTTTVILTKVSGDPELTLNTATGEVSINTSGVKGIYMLVYQICETANPANCDTATVTITVKNSIIAVADAGEGVQGVASSIVNVLDNDTVNGITATTTSVTLTETSSTSAEVSLNTATGSVDISAAAVGGVYTLVYDICDATDATNCDQGTVTVTVKNSIIAIDDAGEGVQGTASSVVNVLGNDTVNGITATTTSVTLTETSSTSAELSLDIATGSVDISAVAVTGVYTLVYSICDATDGTNCDQGTVTVTVKNSIIAIDDAGEGVQGVASSIVNVLDNDTVNGITATTTSVVLTEVSSTSAEVGLNTATGSVDISAAAVGGVYTLVYEICDATDGTNCDQGTVTVTVKNSIIAIDDAGEGAQGVASSVVNVLGNDTVNGITATTTSVTLTEISSTSAELSLDTTTGSVDVSSSAVKGVYTLVYEICDATDGTNCDQGTVTVTVKNSIIAIDDAGEGVQGTAGSVVNVLDNDTVNGITATTTSVTLTEISSTSAEVSLNTVTGVVSISSSVVKGIYTLVYEICDATDGTNCDQGTVTVTVSNSIVAVDDVGTGVQGTASFAVNVLGNDTVNGIMATTTSIALTEVSSTSAEVSLNTATGAVNISSDAVGGVHTLVYKICDILDNMDCDQATVTVTIDHVIVAVDDAGDGIPGVASSVVNVLGNDTVSGATATTSSVTLTEISSTDTEVSLNTVTGEVELSSSVITGVYTLVYEICDNVNSANCDQATVTATVGNTIIAIDDIGEGEQGTASVAVNVLANDKVNSNTATTSSVFLSEISSTSTDLSLNTTNGDVDIEASAIAGRYVLVYEICDVADGLNCEQATVLITVFPPKLEISEGFTSNGDGVNDEFEIDDIEVFYPNYEMIIVNRYGREVYRYKHNGNHNSEPQWWNGFSKTPGSLGGAKLPEGTYFYSIHFNKPGKENRSGWIYLKY